MWIPTAMSAALRAALRQSPDVILLGEMRDFETIHVAMTAAETGHLLFSTLHTIGAAQHHRPYHRCIPAEPATTDCSPVIHGSAGCHITAACPYYRRTPGSGI